MKATIHSQGIPTYAGLKTQLRDEDRDVLERLVEGHQKPAQVLAMLVRERGMPEPQACHYLKRLLRSALSVLQQ